ncbi:MAG TPA: hypothetical protein VFS13_20230 [Steroidobacteraceae bacterium]|jgi:hypothetical protein|nr:hypothetical protein [Steroidobacteraceae bacterium]
MKHGTLALAIVAAGCAAASIYLSAELSAARGQIAQLEQARSADHGRIRELEEAQRRLAVKPALSAQLDRAVPKPAAPSGPPVAEPVKAESTVSPPRFGTGNFPATPAEQNMRRLQLEIRLRRAYADMPAALALDANQADKLFNLLAESQQGTREAMRDVEGGREARQAVEDERRQQRDAAIADLLGPEKAAQFQSFEKSVPARMQVNRIGESMAAANVPLSDAQRTSLIAAVMAEQEVAPPPSRTESASLGDADFQARYLDWQADYSSRVQARVEPLLTAEQAAQYRQAVEVQNARRANQRARVEARRNADAATGGP